MKTEEIKVANVTCASCARTIKNSLMQIKGIADVLVDVENSKVKVTYDNLARKIIADELDSIGYPEVK
jgi:copper chaperone CopZ